MRRIIALFGPAGVGKSTLIKLAKSRGLVAFDLEDLGNSFDGRKSALLKILETDNDGTLFIGAADMWINDFPERTETILLLSNKKDYEARMKQRDEIMPEKQGQNGLEVYEMFYKCSSQFSRIIQNESSPEETLKEIMN